MIPWPLMSNLSITPASMSFITVRPGSNKFLTIPPLPTKTSMKDLQRGIQLIIFWYVPLPFFPPLYVLKGGIMAVCAVLEWVLMAVAEWDVR